MKRSAQMREGTLFPFENCVMINANSESKASQTVTAGNHGSRPELRSVLLFVLQNM